MLLGGDLMLKTKLKLFFNILYIFLITAALTACSGSSNNNSQNNQTGSLTGSKSEEYYMVTFHSGIEYWKGCYKGFEEAGKLYGVKTIYTGGIQYDVNQEVTALEQVIAKRPAGIAITCINPDAFKVPIKEAIAAGIPVVTFDADSPDSGRYSFLGTNNEYSGKVAAETLSELLGNQGGEVAIITNANQENIDQRVTGFKNAIETSYKNLKIVQIGNGKSDETEVAKLVAAFLQAHPDIKGIFCTEATGGVGAATAVKEANKVGKVKIVSFDTDRGTLDAIKSGIISASIAQGTYIMGYQSMNFLFQVKHGLINPVKDWKSKGINPLPTFVDTGVSIVTSKNVDSFYEK
jgi:ribose transport system substrate-binding protein